MLSKKEYHIPRDRVRAACLRKSLLDRIGWKGLLAVGWHSTPLPLRVVALPYTLIVYRRLLAASDSPTHLLVLHSDKYQSSLLFRALRPRFRRICRALDCLEIKSGRATVHPEPSEPYAPAASLPPASSLTPAGLFASQARIAD